MKYETETELGRVQLALKIGLSFQLTQFRASLTTEQAAEVVADVLGDILAASAGSSAVDLGKRVAAINEQVRDTAQATFNILSEVGLN